MNRNKSEKDSEDSTDTRIHCWKTLAKITLIVISGPGACTKIKDWMALPELYVKGCTIIQRAVLLIPWPIFGKKCICPNIIKIGWG